VSGVTWCLQERFSNGDANLEVQRYQRKDQSLKILNEVVEHSESLWIFRVVHVDQ